MRAVEISAGDVAVVPGEIVTRHRPAAEEGQTDLEPGVNDRDDDLGESVYIPAGLLEQPLVVGIGADVIRAIAPGVEAVRMRLLFFKGTRFKRMNFPLAIERHKGVRNTVFDRAEASETRRLTRDIGGGVLDDIAPAPARMRDGAGKLQFTAAFHYQPRS